MKSITQKAFVPMLEILYLSELSEKKPQLETTFLEICRRLKRIIPIFVLIALIIKELSCTILPKMT